MTEPQYAHRQIAYSLRMDWGPTGARRDTHPALRVAVIAAGERWPDGSLRPAAEDQWGAGALIASLCAAGWRDVSPEAAAAAAAFLAVSDTIAPALRACASGRELIELGYPDDVHTAAQLDSSRAVPGLVEAAFTPQLRPV